MKKIFCFFLLSYIMLLGNEKKVIFIYSGPGASKNSLMHTERSIQNAFPQFLVKTISPEEVIANPWDLEAALFILPGGADLPYVAMLKGLGNEKIRSYVEQGGSFLGICAGSYYAGQFVDFAPNTPLEVRGERELAFFPGIVKGPVLAPYDYLSQSGSRKAKLKWSDTQGFEKGASFTVFYNGGGYFLDASQYPNVTILAQYEETNSLAAVIECSVGKGKAILSGAHFESDPLLLDNEDPYLKELIPDLVQNNETRMSLLKHLVERLLPCLKNQQPIPDINTTGTR